MRRLPYFRRVIKKHSFRAFAHVLAARRRLHRFRAFRAAADLDDLRRFFAGLPMQRPPNPRRKHNLQGVVHLTGPLGRPAPPGK